MRFVTGMVAIVETTPVTVMSLDAAEHRSSSNPETNEADFTVTSAVVIDLVNALVANAAGGPLCPDGLGLRRHRTGALTVTSIESDSGTATDRDDRRAATETLTPVLARILWSDGAELHVAVRFESWQP